jgi:hypothetical protein
MEKLYAHLDTAHRAIPAQSTPVCSMCNAAFHARQDLDAHVRSVHAASQTLFCAICSDPCIGLTELVAHVDEDHSAEWSVCPACRSGHAGGGNSGEGAMGCTIAPEYIADIVYYRTGEALEAHRKAVHIGKGRVCHLCGLVSDTKEANRWHRSKAHPTAFPLRCGQCGLRFREDANLKRHAATCGKPAVAASGSDSRNLPDSAVTSASAPTGLFSSSEAPFAALAVTALIVEDATASNDGEVNAVDYPEGVDVDGNECTTYSIASSAVTGVAPAIGPTTVPGAIPNAQPVKSIRFADPLAAYLCGLCTRSFGTRCSAKRHYEAVHMPNACRLCGNVFGTDRWRRHHERVCRIKLRFAACNVHFPEYFHFDAERLLVVTEVPAISSVENAMAD